MPSSKPFGVAAVALQLMQNSDLRAFGSFGLGNVSVSDSDQDTQARQFEELCRLVSAQMGPQIEQQDDGMFVAAARDRARRTTGYRAVKRVQSKRPRVRIVLDE